MLRFRNVVPWVVASFATTATTMTSSRCQEGKSPSPTLAPQGSFVRHHSKEPTSAHKLTLNDLAIITGSAHKQLARDVAASIGVPLTAAKISRYADGEVAVQINESMHGKTVFIIQPCAAPVNDSIMELLLAISCANRAAATRVIAVIPYFGYKHHRRGSALSTTSHSRFLSSSAMDFAKMLQEMGVDHVITVDLQRPGQGHEACFFSSTVPLETILTKELMIDYFVNNIPLQKNVVVISPNTECVKKAKNFQIGLRDKLKGSNVEVAVFDSLESDSVYQDPESKILLGDVKVQGADVVIVDDMVDSAGTLSVLSRRLQQMGASNIYVCASHGLFTAKAMEAINNSPVQKIVVTDSLPLPAQASEKVIQVSVAPMLAQLILREHFRSKIDEQHFLVDDD